MYIFTRKFCIKSYWSLWFSSCFIRIFPKRYTVSASLLTEPILHKIITVVHRDIQQPFKIACNALTQKKNSFIHFEIDLLQPVEIKYMVLPHASTIIRQFSPLIILQGSADTQILLQIIMMIINIYINNFITNWRNFHKYLINSSIISNKFWNFLNI